MLSWFEEIATSLQLFLIALLAWKLCALKNRLLGISWKWVRAWLTGLVLRDLLDLPHDEVALSLALGYIWGHCKKGWDFERKLRLIPWGGAYPMPSDLIIIQLYIPSLQKTFFCIVWQCERLTDPLRGWEKWNFGWSYLPYGFGMSWSQNHQKWMASSPLSQLSLPSSCSGPALPSHLAAAAPWPVTEVAVGRRESWGLGRGKDVGRKTSSAGSEVL